MDRRVRHTSDQSKMKVCPRRIRGKTVLPFPNAHGLSLDNWIGRLSVSFSFCRMLVAFSSPDLRLRKPSKFYKENFTYTSLMTAVELSGLFMCAKYSVSQCKHHLFLHRDRGRLYLVNALGTRQETLPLPIPSHASSALNVSSAYEQSTIIPSEWQAFHNEMTAN